jgi:hypothetical protein
MHNATFQKNPKNKSNISTNTTNMKNIIVIGNASHLFRLWEAGHPQVAIVNNEAGPSWLESATEQDKNMGLFLPEQETEQERVIMVDNDYFKPTSIPYNAPPELKLPTHKAYIDKAKPYKKRVPYKRRNGYF